MHGQYPELEQYWNQSQSSMGPASMHNAADKWITEFGNQNNNPESWANSFEQQYGPNGWASEFEQVKSLQHAFLGYLQYGFWKLLCCWTSYPRNRHDAELICICLLSSFLPSIQFYAQLGCLKLLCFCLTCSILYSICDLNSHLSFFYCCSISLRWLWVRWEEWTWPVSLLWSNPVCLHKH